MSLLRDLRFIERATAIPALKEIVREGLIRAMFVRDERALPKDVVRVLTQRAAVTVRAKDEVEVREAVRLANGEESTVDMGEPAGEFHYYRRRLGVAKDQYWGVTARPRVLQTYDWLVPPQGGVLLDLGGLADVEMDGLSYAAKCGTGAPWKAVYDRAAAVGMLPAVFPSVPLDFAVGDALVGDAKFRSYRASFPSAVYDVRGLAASAVRVNCGFERTPNHATGYDLKDLAVTFGNEFLVPTVVWLRLVPRPPVLQNLAYGFADGAALAKALDALTRSGRPVAWANVYDDRAWRLVHGTDAPGPLAVELGIGGDDALVAARTKALEAALAGSTAKAEAPAPWDGEAAAYAARGAELNRLLFLGEVVVPAAKAGDALARVRALGESKGLRAVLFGSVTEAGLAYLTPGFEAAKEPQRTYDLSRGIADIVRGLGGAVFDSRLAHLWNVDPDFARRVAIVEGIEENLDEPNAVEPPAELAGEPIELFPGGRA